MNSNQSVNVVKHEFVFFIKNNDENERPHSYTNIIKYFLLLNMNKFTNSRNKYVRSIIFTSERVLLRVFTLFLYCLLFHFNKYYNFNK